MTEQTWNKKEIAAAMDKVFQSDMSHKVKLIAELTKPKSVFKVGEIVMCSNQGEKEWPYLWDNLAKEWGSNSVRHLTPEEVPALKLAMGRLERLAETGLISVPSVTEYAQTALDDIKAML